VSFHPHRVDGGNNMAINEQKLNEFLGKAIV